MDFTNKVVAITGGGRGIGRETALYFASLGANISICSTNEGRLEALAKEIEKYDVKVYYQVCDVSKYSDCEDYISNTVEKLGRVDVLVNNAGITKDTLVLRMKEEDWDSVLAVNLKSVFLMSKAVFKFMMKQRSGSIVNTTSVIGQMGNAGQSNYSASKGGIISLTKSLAKEFAGRGIRVNAVAPGFVQTDMTNQLPQDVKDKILENIPLKKMAQPIDIAKSIAFLSSDDASYITGHILSINGGIYM